MAELPHDGDSAGERIGAKNVGCDTKENAGRGTVSALGMWGVSIARVGIDAGVRVVASLLEDADLMVLPVFNEVSRDRLE